MSVLTKMPEKFIVLQQHFSRKMFIVGLQY